MPLGMKAPKLCPADPLKWSRMVSSGSPADPHFRVTSLPVIVPTTRWMFRMGSYATTFSPRSIAGWQMPRSVVRSRDLSSPWSCWIWQNRPTLASTSGW